MAVDARALARQVLPPRLQDLCRQSVDRLLPARRSAARERDEAARAGDALIRKLSPSGRVLDGIFAGLLMPDRGAWGGNLARVAGSYEEELVPHLRRLIAARPSTLIDAGAADGYYAVGLARLLPDTSVLAYEMDPEGRRLLRQVARRNGVTNVAVRGRITPRELRKRLAPAALVVSDVEGYEVELLDPVLVPGLASASMVVELHEFAVPGVTRTILDRFGSSHQIELVDAEAKSGLGRSSLAHLSAAEADQVVDEGRPGHPRMQWAVMSPRRASFDD